MIFLFRIFLAVFAYILCEFWNQLASFSGMFLKLQIKLKRLSPCCQEFESKNIFMPWFVQVFPCVCRFSPYRPYSDLSASFFLLDFDVFIAIMKKLLPFVISSNWWLCSMRAIDYCSLIFTPLLKNSIVTCGCF